MDRTINVTINGEFVRKDSKNAGVQGEGNVTTLHLTFDESWKEFSKRIVWRDSRGENAVAVLLVHDVEARLEGAQEDQFDTPIPSEPLALPGWCSFTLEGFRDEEPAAVCISVSAHLLVKPNDDYTAPAEPTGTQAQQLQTQLGGILEQMTGFARDLNVFEPWDSGKTYREGSKVAWKGSSYYCLNECTGADPAEDVGEGEQGSHWMLIAKKGDKGDTGFAPTVKVSKVKKTTTVTITDINGPHTATILDGEDGEGAGDMLASTYDTEGRAEDIFQYTDAAAHYLRQEHAVSLGNTGELEDYTLRVGRLTNAGAGWNTYKFPAPLEAAPQAVLLQPQDFEGWAQVKAVTAEGFLYCLRQPTYNTGDYYTGSGAGSSVSHGQHTLVDAAENKTTEDPVEVLWLAVEYNGGKL